jgi:hypothetical protein
LETEIALPGRPLAAALWVARFAGDLTLTVYVLLQVTRDIDSSRVFPTGTVVRVFPLANGLLWWEFPTGICDLPALEFCFWRPRWIGGSAVVPKANRGHVHALKRLPPKALSGNDPEAGLLAPRPLAGTPGRLLGHKRRLDGLDLGPVVRRRHHGLVAVQDRLKGDPE